MAASPSAGVFINCPFDDHYQPIFEAVVFCVSAVVLFLGVQKNCQMAEMFGLTTFVS